MFVQFLLSYPFEEDDFLHHHNNNNKMYLLMRFVTYSTQSSIMPYIYYIFLKYEYRHT